MCIMLCVLCIGALAHCGLCQCDLEKFCVLCFGGAKYIDENQGVNYHGNLFFSPFQRSSIPFSPPESSPLFLNDKLWKWVVREYRSSLSWPFRLGLSQVPHSQCFSYNFHLFSIHILDNVLSTTVIIIAIKVQHNKYNLEV